MRYFEDKSGAVWGFSGDQGALIEKAWAEGMKELAVWPRPKTQAEIDAEESAAAKRELAALDLASIRDLRAWVAAQPSAPQMQKDREAAAVAARARVLP